MWTNEILLLAGLPIKSIENQSANKTWLVRPWCNLKILDDMLVKWIKLVQEPSYPQMLFA